MNKKILCVDDEESILKGFQLHLRKGFDLFTANSGEDGLRVFDEEGEDVPADVLSILREFEEKILH